MINTLMLIDDENLFHLVFEDACSILDMALSFEALDSSDEADAKFKAWFPDDPNKERPECVFVDLNIIGSSYDGIEMIRKINYEYGDGVVIGIISSSEDDEEIEGLVGRADRFAAQPILSCELLALRSPSAGTRAARVHRPCRIARIGGGGTRAGPGVLQAPFCRQQDQTRRLHCVR